MSGAKEVIKRYASEAHLLAFRGGEVDEEIPKDFSLRVIKDAEQGR